jgi:hypothetical protein
MCERGVAHTRSFSELERAGASQRLRRGIVAAQVAMTLVPLSAGGLVARSFERLLASDPGFISAGALTFRVAMDPRLFPKTADAFAFRDRVETALGALHGVSSVSATAALPLAASAPNSIWAWRELVAIPGAPGNTGDAQRDSVVDIIATRAGYAESMGMRILTGRAFEHRRPDNVREAVVDQQLARRFFPTGTPIGASVRIGDRDGHGDQTDVHAQMGRLLRRYKYSCE